MEDELYVRVGRLSSSVRRRNGKVIDVQVYRVGQAAVGERNGVVSGSAPDTSSSPLIRLLIKWDGGTQEVILVENFDIVAGGRVSDMTVREGNASLLIAFTDEETGTNWIARRLTSYRRNAIGRIGLSFPIVGALLPIALLHEVNLSAVFGFIAGAAFSAVAWLLSATYDVALMEYTRRLRRIAGDRSNSKDQPPVLPVRQNAPP